METIQDDFARFKHEGWQGVADKYDSVWSPLTRQFILLLLEPDFLPVSVAESTLAPRLASLGLTKISGTAEPVIYNGGSLWADYCTKRLLNCVAT